ncbi:MAG: cyclic nucleotide-binding domain-containing protein [Burkholderiales bacterium]|nr:cyclic nucleotide-binding domain-containing protein [Burkholderiales bacterium]
MEDLDFAPAPKSKIYDPAVAMTFFKSAGTVENVGKGKPFFSENEKPGGFFSRGAKMYLLVTGEVGLTAGSKVIGTVGKGEVFGEMASIGQMPRSATAVARSDCQVISLDEKQFRKAIEKAPDFALMLMSMIIERLRHSITRLTGSNVRSDDETLGRRSVFDRKLLADLEREFEGHAPVHAPKNKVIMTEGEVGAFMYVLLEGRVGVSIKGRVIEKLGAGGVFGEMALVDKSPRIASAVAETDCSMLTINRRDFLVFVKTKPDFSLSLLKALAERLRYINSQIR